MKKIGSMLLALGIAMTAITGLSFITREKVLDLGFVEVSTKANFPAHWSPILGGVLLTAGVLVLLASKKN